MHGAESIVEYLVGSSRMLAGGRRPFAEAPARSLVRRDIERARDFAAIADAILAHTAGRGHGR